MRFLKKNARTTRRSRKRWPRKERNLSASRICNERKSFNKLNKSRLKSRTLSKSATRRSNRKKSTTKKNLRCSERKSRTPKSSSSKNKK